VIPMPSGVRVCIATGHTDMRHGMQGLGLQVQEQLKRDPHVGDLYIFRGRRGDLAKVLWHDGIGLSLYAKRLDRGKFVWPSAKEGVVSISARRWPPCWKESTGAIPNSPGDPRAPDESAGRARWLIAWANL
jgi:transposase